MLKLKQKKNNGTKFTIFYEMRSFITNVLIVKDAKKTFAIETSNILFVEKYKEEINNKILIKDRIYEIMYKSKKPNFVVITKNNKAIVVEKIIGIFDGKFVPKEFPNIKGFVKNIFSFPVPVLDLQNIKNEFVESKTKPKILLIDDSVTTRKIVSKLLEKYNFEVTTAKDGVDGIEKFKNEKFDLVICDVEMPNLGGFETAKRIKNQYNVPIILFSTISKENIQKAINIADTFISKDEPPTVLVNTIRKLLGESYE